MGLFSDILSILVDDKKKDNKEFIKEEIEKGNYEPYEMEEEELDDDMPYYSSDDE